MHYLLESKECENYGGVGLLIKGKSSRPYFDPSQSATGLTHDILEHPYTQVGNPIEDELMAIGGYYYIRVLGGYRTNYGYIREEGLTNSIYSLLEDTYYDFEITDPKQYRVNDSDYNEVISTAVRKGVNTYKEYNKDEDCFVELTQQQVNFIKGWICRGFSYTKARYRNLDSCDLVYRFNRIEKDLASLFKSIEYEGQQFKVNINLQTNTVNWKEISDEKNYY